MPLSAGSSPALSAKKKLEEEMNIEQIVSEKMAEITKSGFIEGKIKASLERTIESAISDTLKSYSDFGKHLKEELKKSLQNVKFSFPEYNQLVANQVMEIVNNTLIKNGKKEIEEDLKKFFQPLEETKWKISEIIQEFKDYLQGEIDKGGISEITFIRKERRDVIYYYFSEKENQEDYECEYRIAIKKIDKKIWSMTIDESDVSKMKIPLLFGFESFLFKLYAINAEIEDDGEDVETECRPSYNED